MLKSTFGDAGAFSNRMARGRQGNGVILPFVDAFPGAKFPSSEAPPAGRGLRWSLVLLGCDNQPRVALSNDANAVQPITAVLARPRAPARR